MALMSLRCGCACALILVWAACVNLEKRDMEEARARLDACVLEHGRDAPECEEAALALRDAQERYDEKARKAWSCDPTQDPCPTPR
jgi:hypothetical protein